MKKSGFIARLIVSLILVSLIVPFTVSAQTDQNGNENPTQEITSETSPTGQTTLPDMSASPETTGMAEVPDITKTEENPTTTTTSTSTTTEAPPPSSQETEPTSPPVTEPEEESAPTMFEQEAILQSISPLGLAPDSSSNPNYYIDGVKSNYKKAMSGSDYFVMPTVHNPAATADTEIPVPSVTKISTPVAGMVNTWDIALEIMSKDVRKTADIVLVIDTSGSMSGAKLTSMKNAANTFINTVLANDTTRVAIVDYNYFANASIGFRNSSNKQQLITFVDGRTAGGGTFTQDALLAAEKILDAYSTASFKHIVLLSDGLPTYSYPLKDPNLYLGVNQTGRVYESVSGDSIVYPTTNRYDAYRQNGVPASPQQAMFDLNQRIGAGNAQHVMYYDADKTIVEYEATLDQAGGYFLYNGGNLYTTKSSQGRFDDYITIGSNRYYPVGTYYTRSGSYPYTYNLLSLPAARYTITSDAGDGVSRYHYLPANTIAQSKIAQQKGYIVHTVALAVGADPNTGVDGDMVLRDIASTPQHAYKASTDNLSVIFATIAGSIISSISDATVIDPMGPGFAMMYAGGNPLFDADGQSVGVGAGEASYNSSTKTVTWNVGTLSTPISIGGQPYHYERLTYRVEIDDGILAPSASRFDRKPDGTGTANSSGSFYQTNGTTTLTYKNSASAQATPINFPIPVVNPIFLKVTKILQDAAGNTITDPNLTFAIRVQSDATDGDSIYPEYDRTFNLKSGESVITTDLRLADDYTMSETPHPDYETTYKVNGSVTAAFIVAGPSGSPRLDSGQGDIELEVRNKEKIKPISLTLTGTKTLVGRQLQTNEFTFELYPANSSGAITGTLLQTKQNSLNGSFSFNALSFTQAGTHYYLIKEVLGSASGMNYDSREYLVKVTITVVSGVLQPQTTYQVRESGQAFSAAGSVEFINKVTTDVSIDKIVSGFLGDVTKIFTFEAQIMTAGGDPAVYDIAPPVPGAGYSYNAGTGIYSFNLKHGENVDLPELPVTAQIWLRETNTADYTITVTSGSGSGVITYTPSGGWYKIPIAENISIHVENSKNAIPDTGINLDSWPYILILGLAGLGAASFFFIPKRRNKD